MNYALYQNYKPGNSDWLREIPDTWQQIRSRFVMGVNPSPERLRDLDETDEVSFVPMEAVGEYGGLNLERSKSLDEIGSGYTEFEDGDVVVAKITPCFENGKGALAEGLLNGVAFGTTELHVLRAGQQLDARFLFYLTISHTFRKLGESEMYGAGGQKRVPPEFAKDFRVPLPRVDEQEAIVRFLDAKTAQIDALVAKKRQLIAKLKEKRSALIARTVTRGLPPEVAKAAGLEPNPEMKPLSAAWADECPRHWEVWKIAHGFRITGSGTTPPSDNEDWYDGDVPWVTTSELRESVIHDTSKKVSKAAINELSALKIFPAGALAIAMYGATIGRLGILGVPSTTNQACCVLAEGIAFDKDFLFCWFQAFREQIVMLATGGGQPNISQEKIRSLRIPCPDLEEQQQIALFLKSETEKIDGLVEATESAIDRLTEYRQALITSAVTGKIDVRNLDYHGVENHASAALS